MLTLMMYALSASICSASYCCNLKTTGNVYLTLTVSPFCVPGFQLGID